MAVELCGWRENSDGSGLTIIHRHRVTALNIAAEWDRLESTYRFATANDHAGRRYWVDGWKAPAAPGTESE
jgi:hypothetical protein